MIGTAKTLFKEIIFLPC